MTPPPRAPALSAEAIAGVVRPANAARPPLPSVRAEEDAELARRCVAGDASAQRSFVERYSRMLFSVCRRRGLRADAAEDVTQEVLADAFRALPRYRGEARLSSWLFTLVSRRVASHYRAVARAPVAVGHAMDPGFPSPGVEDGEAGMERRDRAERVREAVSQLEEPARTILTAYYVAEMAVAEIAAELDLPVNTVKSHLHRGRLALRRMLETP